MHLILGRRLASLQTKLTLTYTLVTVAALLAVEIVILSLVVLVSGLIGAGNREYISDVVYSIYYQSNAYLNAEPPDITGIQRLAEQIYASGYASVEPVGLLDSPAAPIDMRHDLYVVAPDYTILAQAPEPTLVGQQYSLPDEMGSANALDEALALNFNPNALYQPLADGSWFIAVPLDGVEGDVAGAIVLNIEPAPPFVQSYLPLLGSIVGVTALVLLIGVTPFGALFGYIMARSLTGRLAKLEATVDAWGQGDFKVMPQDRSQDEIGRLGMRMKHMALQIENLLEDRQELATLEERNRLARELHDTVKQQNFATLMQVRAAKNLAKSGEENGSVGERLDSAETLLKQSQQDLKSLIDELRPAQLEGQGLPVVLRHYTLNWSEQNGIPIELMIQGERALPLEVEQTLYRVAQEALANVARHSDATEVKMKLQYTKQTVCLTAADNGRGFEPTSVKRGFGLSAMRQRMTEWNGTLTVLSRPGQGTIVTAELAI